MSFRKITFDVTKLDKARFYKGQKGTYCTLLVFDNDEPDQYGNDCVVKEDQTKEERERKERAKIVGNGKILGGAKPQQHRAPDPDPTDSVPF